MSDAKLPDPIFRTYGMFVVVLKRLPKTESISTRKTSEKTRVETRVETKVETRVELVFEL
ncbi:MAG: hypothetical protein IPH20_19600 [Bacteroidales bacterium]|nr:hypothetical protein [Bacteroidales bacterium]